MTTVDNRIITALRTQQQITEYIIYSRNNADINDYQVLLTNVPSKIKEDVVCVYNGKIIPHWVESKGNVWVKIPKLTINPIKIYTLTGNSSAINQSDGNNTFIFFDDFSTSLNKWTVVGDTAIVNGELKITGTSVWNANGVTSVMTIPRSTIIEINSHRMSTTGLFLDMIGYGVTPLNYQVGLYLSRDTTDLYRYLDNTASILTTSTNDTTLREEKFLLKPTTGYTLFYEGTQIEDNTTYTTSNQKIAIQMFRTGLSLLIANVFVRKYIINEPKIIQNKKLNKSLLIKNLLG